MSARKRPISGQARPGAVRRRVTALALSGALGAAAALLVSCGSSAKLIPVANSEPLQADFEEVARDAEAAHGDCGATEASLRKAEHDLANLPSSVDAGLRKRLGEGLRKLRADAQELCATPSTQTTQATTAPRTTSTPTTQTNTQATTQTTNTQATTTQTTTTTPPGGGTPAKEGEAEEPAGAKKDHKDEEGGPSGGAAPEGGGK
ncbi:MAG TPA: hypothetical protein VGX51_03290 [Solirubrobacteraceae bacterium]|nr:hypothetical protein [Solirubrobacteraceae bacterium]